MEYSFEMCKQLLDEKVGITKKERIENNIRWLSYWNHIAKEHASGKGFSDSFPHSVVQELKSQGVIDKNSSVIDIGCGSGSYTIDFAKECREVLGVDMSQKMLEVLKKRALESGFTNILAEKNMFENLKTEKYDMVFAAMCPAISDYESIVEFEGLSNKWCCIVTVAKGSSSKIRSELRNLLTNESLKGFSPDVIYQFNMLYAMGRFPQIRFHSFTSQPKMTAQKALENYKIYYNIFGLNEPKHHKIILDYLNNIAVDGICTDEVTYNMAVMWWQVN